GKLADENERVERDVALDAAAMQLVHERGQLGHAEVLRACAGVEARVEAKVNRVCAVFDRRPDAVVVAGGGEQFGANTYEFGHSIKSRGRAEEIEQKETKVTKKEGLVAFPRFVGKVSSSFSS